MKRVIGALVGLALGLGALTGPVLAQEEGILGDADGGYVAAGPGAPANGDGGTLVYGDIQTGTTIGPPVTLPPPVPPTVEEAPPPVDGGGEPAPAAPVDGGAAPAPPVDTGAAPPPDQGAVAQPSATDPDADNLTDEAEAIQGTDPFNPDSDADFLADGDELNIYRTAPLAFDTDGDGRGDGAEVFGDQTDPLVFDAAPVQGETAPAAFSAAQTASTTADEGEATTFGDGAASAAPGAVTAPGNVVLSAPAATCAGYVDWYSAQTAFEAAGGLAADPTFVANLDPDYDGIACEERMEA